MNVGTKELKNRLSHYLRCVRQGEVVRVTDRGEVVAELRPVKRPEGDDDRGLQALELLGLVTVGSGRFGDFSPVRARRGKRASGIVIGDRG